MVMVMVMVMVPPGQSFALDMTDMVFMWCSTFCCLTWASLVLAVSWFIF